MTISWISIVWPLIAGVCVAAGGIHLSVWARQSAKHAHLAFAGLAFSLAIVILIEFQMMRAETPEQFGMLLRWMHVPGLTAVFAAAIFIRLQLPHGRVWIAYAACGLRVVVVMINFSVEPNLNYQAIHSLQRIEVFGDTVSIAVGEPSARSILGLTSLLLLALFAADSAIAGWRHGGEVEHRRAFTIGAGFAFVLAIAAINTALIHGGFIQSIYLHGIISMVLVTFISNELDSEWRRSVKLAEQLDETDAALRTTERRLDEAAEAAQLGIWEWDLTRDTFWFSRRGRELFGLDPVEPINLERMRAVLEPGDWTPADDELAHVLKEGGSYERLDRLFSPEGRARWILTRGRAEYNAAGKAVRMRGVSLDITDRHIANDRFRRVVQAAPVGIVILNAAGRIALVNPEVERIFGYARQELVGQSVEMLLPERYRGAHVSHRARYDADPSTRSMAGRVIGGLHKDGTEVPLEIALNPLLADDGPGTIATLIDVSERQHHDQLMRQERGFLRQVIDIVPHLIFAKDRNGRYTLANQAIADLLGTTPADMLGRTDGDFNANVDEVAAFREADLQVMNTRQEVVIAEERINDAKGGERWLHTIKRPILDADGTANQVLGWSSDITAQRVSERNISQLRNEIAHLSRVTMLSELSGSLAHELNQPLTAILSNAQAALRFLAQDQPKLDEACEILHDIVKDDNRAGEVIKGLRLLLKKGEMRRERLNMTEVAGDVLRLVRSDMLNSGIALRTDFEPDLPAVSGDRVQLQQVLLNLITNGSDAMAGMPARSRLLEVSIGRGAGDEVRICVSDRGRGIAPEHLERIFDPFFTTKSEGLGLGLSVCRTIVTAHGGRLWAANNTGPGASLCMTLPPDRGDPK